MAFWDFFSDKPKEKDLPPGKKTHYQGDLSKTDILNKLCQIPKAQRDERWREKFLSNVADAGFRCANPQMIKGPDDFPYFILILPGPFQNFQAFTIRHMKDDFLLDAGYGIVINPQGNQADWVFSYGDIVNFQVNGEFYTGAIRPHPEDGELMNQTEQMQISQPSEKYLPKTVRSVIKDFLKSMGVEKPMVMLVTRNIDGVMARDLAFNIYQQDFPTTKHFDFTLQHLAWFLPRHYSVLSFPKANNFESRFAEL